ncbi:protein of unknown function [Limnospira indica PCC 8005]|uniref:Uncharacterized protein n=1 Tax=Limnospira indica PCC 8005 TaxID=376219 RepID=A0A9P1NYZ6_9CYAN|nr:protein of unknown function [Limnospira indica PCC 8005]
MGVMFKRLIRIFKGAGLDETQTSAGNCREPAPIMSCGKLGISWL